LVRSGWRVGITATTRAGIDDPVLPELDACRIAIPPLRNRIGSELCRVNPDLSPGDLVIGTEVGYHDYGYLLPDSLQRRPTRNPATMQENPLYFPCDGRLVQLAYQASGKTTMEKTDAKDSIAPRVIKGRIVTGDVFVSSQAATAALYRQMNAEATEMEGAAVAQACWQQQVPFVVIRSMSDKAGNNAYMDLQSFYHIAARNSANLVMTLVGMLN